MFGLGIWELVLILILLIFFYGTKRLPQIGESVGKSVREFKHAYRTHDHTEKIDKAPDEAEQHLVPEKVLYLTDSNMEGSNKNSDE